MTLPVFAIITPCFRESDATLSRMMKSVVAQAEPCHHVVVADGVPRTVAPEIYAAYSAAGHMLSFIELPAGMANSGAGPRALGAAYAFSKGAEWASFLDADNALAPQHLTAIKQMALPGVAAVVTERRVFLKDTGEETPRESSEHKGTHIDTNCLVLSRRCAALLGIWLHWPRAFGTGEDRIFSAILNATGRTIARTDTETVLYWSDWPIHYALANKPVPPTAKRPSRRAATHFHAASFFSIAGQWPITDSWRQVNAKPLVANTRTMLVCQYVPPRPDSEATHLPGTLNVKLAPVCFSDVFVTHGAHELTVPWLLDNQSVLKLPVDAGETYGLATMASVAFHQGYKHLLWLSSSALARTHDLDTRLRHLGQTITYRGVTCVYVPADAGDALLAVLVATDLGPLLTRLACWQAPKTNQVPTPSSSTNSTAMTEIDNTLKLSIVQVLSGLCRTANVPCKGLKLL